jgi:hypothetical protein
MGHRPMDEIASGARAESPIHRFAVIALPKLIPSQLDFLVIVIEAWNAMTVEEVQELVRLQMSNMHQVTNDHRITLQEAIVPPQRIVITARTVERGNVKDQQLDCWLVGQEDSCDGYKIILREDGSQFGLASRGFLLDKYLILTGWYGDLMSAFLSM